MFARSMIRPETIKFKLLDKTSRIPYYDHEDDAAFGIFSVENKVLKPMEIYAVATGISSEFPKGYFVSIRDRSSMGIKGMHVLGGVIDAGYRGEWKIILINLSGDKYKIEAGDKIAQGIFQKLPELKIVNTEKLNKSGRGTKGFGSTGK